MGNKYGAIRTNGSASKKEARRVAELRLLERAGEISQLIVQPVFRLEANGQLICKYIADASYVEDGVFVVEDVKSPITAKNPVYRLKKRLMLVLRGVTIRET